MRQLALHYARTGHTRLKVRTYAGGRHEMLNETNRDEVMRDWLDWIARSLSP
jgi:alpha-beta hydrolase superfamily lysophospholipase